MLSLLESEINANQVSNEALDKSYRLVETTSADFTNQAFMAEPQSACLRSALFSFFLLWLTIPFIFFFEIIDFLL